MLHATVPVIPSTFASRWLWSAEIVCMKLEITCFLGVGESLLKSDPADAVNVVYYSSLHCGKHAAKEMFLSVCRGLHAGKAVYEGILLELPLANFFLKKFRSSFCDINDLPSLDPEMYRSLVTLRNYPGEVSDLCLSFTVVDSIYGDNREVELKPGGRDTSVTNENAIEYIHRVADYRLNQQVKAVCRAFLQGFYEVISPEWVRMFSAAELQMLVSGSQDGLDLVDMQANVEYGGGYHEGHPVIRHLWEALETFPAEDQRGFLKFVTGCSRAPLLGFQYLQPHMCIQMAGTVLDEASKQRLPTASTCMNLLKLPPYSTMELAREKLLYAINAASGFDLS